MTGELLMVQKAGVIEYGRTRSDRHGSTDSMKAVEVINQDRLDERIQRLATLSRPKPTMPPSPFQSAASQAGPGAFEPFAYPPGFHQRYGALTDPEALFESLARPILKSLRVNTLLTTVDEVVELLRDLCDLEPVLWCPGGFFIQNPEVQLTGYGNLPGHSAGLFYIQEATSMVPVRVLDPKPDELILDLCAAPGGKTTQMAQYMENRGRIWAVDPKAGRLNTLRGNLRRMGVANVTLKRETGSDLAWEGRLFDRVLVDAPCSGTGTMRNWWWKAREGHPIDEQVQQRLELKGEVHQFLGQLWGRNHFRHLARTQRNLLHRAYRLLRRGGTMVYSTCSLEPEENEGVLDWMVRRHPRMEVETIRTGELPGLRSTPTLEEWEGTQYSPKVSCAQRIMPQDNHTDGFFIARLRKPE